MEKDESVRFEEARGEDAPPDAQDEGEDRMSFQAWMAAIVRIHSRDGHKTTILTVV